MDDRGPRLGQAAISEGEYNALDLAATDRVFKEMRKVHADALFDHACMGPALTMGLRGLRVDFSRRSEILEETYDEAKQYWDVLRPYELREGKALAPSAQGLHKVLYGKLRAPVQWNRDGNPTCDRDALNKIIEHRKTPDEAVEVARAALELRRLEEDRKVLTKQLGPDGRMHTGFGVASTVTSRWSSSKDAFGEGANLHALSRRVRQIFCADPGYTLVSFDQKQAESYCVAYLASSQWYKEAHRSGNVHALIGARIWPEPFEGGKAQAQATPLPWQPDQSYYDLAKRTQHGFNYLLTEYGFARQGKMPVQVARDIREAYLSFVPEVSEWHRSVAGEIRSKHRLTTPMGRTRVFLGRPWESSTVKEAVAFVPQSTISDITKVALYHIWDKLDPEALQVLLEVHDSVIFQVREGDMGTINEAFGLCVIEVPFPDDVMVVPWEPKMGLNWGDASEANPNGLKGFKL